MTQPHLILVAGPPAAGKTSIARQLAKALRLPLICKDTLKESLFDHLGSDDWAWSKRLGYAVILSMYALAREILDGGASLILESTFTHPDTPGELHELLTKSGARLSVVYCYATPRVLSERFNARTQTSWHPGHQDGATTPVDFSGRDWSNHPHYPGKIIPVDTTDFSTVSVADILHQLD